MSEDTLLVVIGPSGVGKTSLVRLLHQASIVYPLPSWTTRKPRPGENDIDHVFVSEEEFMRREADGFFLETVRLFGLPYAYGLPKISTVTRGVIPVLLLRASLVPLLKKHYQNHIIYQIEDTRERILERLGKRQAIGEVQGERIGEWEKELMLGKQYAHRIFTNDSSIEKLARDVEAAIAIDFKGSV